MTAMKEKITDFENIKITHKYAFLSVVFTLFILMQKVYEKLYYL